MSELTVQMEVFKVTVLRCPTCGYEKRLPGIYDPEYLDKNCPACVDPGRWAGWATKRGAEPVKFDTQEEAKHEEREGK
jgi:hypothetical protein